ncbi:MAG TPA: hypothetical protein VF204_03780 [Streptosporangiaceae bacterium]
MSEPVKSRTYHSSVREEQARRTRQAILDAARRPFAEQGWDASRFAAWPSDAWTRLFLASPEA